MLAMKPSPDLISDLRPVLVAVLSTGISQAEVARRLVLSRASVCEAARDSAKPWMPGWSTGERLWRLHQELVGRSDAG